MVFYKTIDEWLNPEQLLVRPLMVLPLEHIVAAAQTIHPEWPTLANLTYPLHYGTHFRPGFEFQKTLLPHYAGKSSQSIPTAASRLGERQWGDYFVSVVYELHKSLLLEETGETIIGVLAFILFLSVGTGIYLWWPSTGNVRRAFSFKPGSSTIRREYDLHKLSGISGALVLLMLAGTGFISSSRAS